MTNLEILNTAESFTITPTEATIAYVTEKYKEITGKDLHDGKAWIQENNFDQEGEMKLELKSYDTLLGQTAWITLDIDTDFIVEAV